MMTPSRVDVVEPGAGAAVSSLSRRDDDVDVVAGLDQRADAGDLVDLDGHGAQALVEELSA